MARRRYQGPRRTQPVERIIELSVGGPAHGGACVARDEDGRVVFVRHALPGERVRARITSTRKTLAWADAVEILEPCEDRIDSVWPQAGPGGVGGGELAHVRPAAQRAWKRDVIAGQLRRVGGEELARSVDDLGGVRVEAAPTDTDPDDLLTGRRTRIELVIDEGGRPGMHRYRGSDVVALDDMPLAVDSIRSLGLFEADSPWRDRFAPADRVRVVAPNGTDPVVITPSGIFDAQARPTDIDALTWTISVDGRDYSYRVRPTGFWQTHIAGAQVLAGAVNDSCGITEGMTVMELYSGAGLFTSVLADGVGSGGRLVSLEGDEGAVADANANVSDYPWVETFVGDVDAAGVGELAGEAGAPIDLVLLDPPRAGAGRDVCEAVTAVAPTRIALVSCDPAAGARDLRFLTEAGYALESFAAWDLFPHTHHVETLAVAVRRG